MIVWMKRGAAMRAIAVASLTGWTGTAWVTPAAAAPPAATAPPATAPAPGGDVELSGDESGNAASFNTCRKQRGGTKFRITLPEEAELKDLVNWMMSVSCQKFIWDPKVRGGKVTILSPEPVTIHEAYAAFYAALQTMGLTVEPAGEYFKIVESTDAKSRNLPVFGPEGNAPANDRYVTQLFRVESGQIAEIVDLLNKIKSKQGSVDRVGDLILLTDTGTNVSRMLRIIREIDDPEAADKNEKIFFFQLSFADPEETAETIREIFGEKDQSGGARAPTRTSARTAAKKPTEEDGTHEPTFSRVVVDDRTGTIIIVAPEVDYQVIRRLIERLDVPLAGGGGRIHVVKLKNADPEEVATVLNQLGSGAGRTDAQGQQPPRRGAANAPANQPQAPATATTADLFSGNVKVTADPATRSLVILSSTADFKVVRNVITELDQPRKQVYIEVYLMEVTVSKVTTAGAGGHFGRDFQIDGQPGLGFVGSAPDAAHNSLLLSPSVLSGLAAGVIGPQVPNSAGLLGLQRDIPAFGVIIQALQENNDVNFVAEPHLYTADNQEASIEVGRNVPTQGGVTFPGGAAGGGGIVPFQSIQRQDVTLNVKITPHVNDESQVTLDIELENNDIESVDPNLGVTTTKRRLKLDAVLARNDQPVVLGGLVQEVERVSTNQVPGLGSIPLLGWLFKSKRRERIKVNLMMILVPHILETPDDVRRIHTQRMKERLEFVERASFEHHDLSTIVNYRKKSGLLSQINREAGRMEDEERFRDQADLELQQQVITGELGMSPSFSEEVEEVETAAEPAAAPVEPKPKAPAKKPARPRTP